MAKQIRHLNNRSKYMYFTLEMFSALSKLTGLRPLTMKYRQRTLAMHIMSRECQNQMNSTNKAFFFFIRQGTSLEKMLLTLCYNCDSTIMNCSFEFGPAIHHIPRNIVVQIDLYDRSRIVRKPDFCLGENKGADQLRGNREADQRLCFRYTDSIFRLLLISEISSF